MYFPQRFLNSLSKYSKTRKTIYVYYISYKVARQTECERKFFPFQERRIVLSALMQSYIIRETVSSSFSFLLAEARACGAVLNSVKLNRFHEESTCGIQWCWCLYGNITAAFAHLQRIFTYESETANMTLYVICRSYHFRLKLLRTVGGRK